MVKKQNGASRLAMGTGPQHFAARIVRTPVLGVGSPLLRQLAAQVWDEVTDGTGVLLDEHGKPIEAPRSAKKSGGKA
jgi:hypothetical protein